MPQRRIQRNGDCAVHKGVINDAGIAFTGHTEYLAQLTNSEAVMLLVGGGMRVALATTHLPLKDVPAAITRDTLERKLRIIHTDLINRFAIARPRIAVAGLNPHAGESGHLGKEEIEIIIPALEALPRRGWIWLARFQPIPSSIRQSLRTSTAYLPCTTTRGYRY